MFIRDAANRGRHRRRGFNAHAKVADAISGNVIKAGADDEKIGPHGPRYQRQHLLPDRNERLS
jgi:hypothetical protein